LKSALIMLGLCYLWSFIFISMLGSVFTAEKGKLEDVLPHFETLDAGDIFHGFHKRDINMQEKIVSFTTLGRHFKLHLTPHSELFSEDFHAYAVDQDDNKTEVTVDKDTFYRGYDEGDSTSRARVHVDHGVLTASITTKDDTYVVEVRCHGPEELDSVVVPSSLMCEKDILFFFSVTWEKKHKILD